MKKSLSIIFFIIVFTFMPIQAFAATDIGDEVNILGNTEVDRPLTGSIVSILGNIHARSVVNGEIVAVLGNINVESTVNGDVVAVLGKVTLGPNASVAGDVVAIGIGGIQRSPGARISGDAVSISLGDFNSVPLLRFMGKAGFVLMLLLGLLMTALAGNKVKEIVTGFQENLLRKVLIGILGFVCFLIAIPFLVMTVIGLPIGIVFFVIVLFTGFAALNVYLGQNILDLLNSKAGRCVEYLVGAIVIAIIFTTFQSSWWIVGIVTVFSLGLGLDVWVGKDKKAGQKTKNFAQEEEIAPQEPKP